MPSTLHDFAAFSDEELGSNETNGMKHFCVKHDACIGQHLFIKHKKIYLNSCEFNSSGESHLFLLPFKTVATSTCSLGFTHNLGIWV